VTVVHQHSHKKLWTTRSVGNALADLKAEQARLTEGAKPLPLEQQMGRYVIRVAGNLLISDIKKPLKKKAAERALDKWMKSKTQGDIIRQLPNAATTIRKYRKELASSTGALANILSTAIGKRSYDPKWKNKTKYCRYCRITRGKKVRNSIDHQETCWTDTDKMGELQEEMAEIIKLWEPGWTTEKQEPATEEHKGTAWRLTRKIAEIAKFYKGAKMTITIKDGNESRQAPQHKVYELAMDYAKTCGGKGTIPKFEEFQDTLSAVLHPDPRKGRAQRQPDSAAMLGKALVGTHVIWDASWYLRPNGYQIASKIAAEQNLGALPLTPAAVVNKSFYFAPLTEVRTISALGLAKRLTTLPGSTTTAVGLVTLGPGIRNMIQRKRITIIVRIPRGCITMGGTQKRRKRNRKALAVVLLVGEKQVDFEENTRRVALLLKWSEQFCPKATTFPERMMQELTGQDRPKVPTCEDWTKLLGSRMAWTQETPATAGILTNAGLESMQDIGASREFVGKVKAQLLRRLKAYTKDQGVKRTQMKERETKDLRALREDMGRRDKEKARVERALAMSGQLMQDALEMILSPPATGPICTLSDEEEDEGDAAAADTDEEKSRVEGTLAMASLHMRDAMDRLLAPPDAAPQWTLSDLDEDEAPSEAGRNTSDSDTEERDSDKEEQEDYEDHKATEEDDSQGPSRLLAQAAMALRLGVRKRWTTR
jgi:hypothetical protein